MITVEVPKTEEQYEAMFEEQHHRKMPRISYQQRMEPEEIETVIRSMEEQTGCKVYVTIQEQVILTLDDGTLPFDEAEVNRCSSKETGDCFYAETLDGDTYIIPSPGTVHRPPTTV